MDSIQAYTTITQPYGPDHANGKELVGIEMEENNGNVEKQNDQQMSTQDGNALTHCYHCGIELSVDTERCPDCGRRQHRICYCGKRVPVTVENCPYCGADWSGSRRVRRKSRQARRVKSAAVLRSALIGAAIALGLMVVANILVKHFAQIGGDGAVPPADIMIQLDLAAVGVQRAMSSWADGIRVQSTTIGSVLIGLLVGAGIGAVGYLTSIGILHLSDKKNKSKRRRRSSRTPDA